jgi:PAS domain S-box-containing protein
MNNREETKDVAALRFGSLFHELESAVVIYRAVDDGKNFVFVSLNRAAQQLENIDEDSAVSKSIDEVFPGVEEFGLLDVFRRVWKTGKAEHLPITFYRDNRVAGWRENHVYKLATGEIASVYTDATEAKQAEEHLRHSEERYRRLVENLRQEYYFFSHDIHGVFTYLSPSIEDILGYSTEEYRTDYDKHFTDDPVNEAARQYTKRSIAGEQQQPYEVDIRHRSGGPRRLEVLETPVFDSEGRVIAVEGIARDITTRRATEHEILKAQKLEALGVLAGGIAHDFNNLLTVIIGNLSMAAPPEGWGDDTPDEFEDARQAADQAKHLTQQLLTFSRGGKPVKQRVALNELITEAVSLATSGSNIVTRFNLGDLPQVEADPGQFLQVVSNLCINAVQAMDQGGTLEITSEMVEVDNDSGMPVKPGPHARIRLRDEGTGILPENLGRIFDPYFTTRDTGTGLGLTVCYSIVRNHGGHIRVDPVPGQGTTVELYLPATTTVPAPRSKATQTRGASGRRVLVMDDDPRILRMARRILAMLGYEVTTADDGAEAISHWKEAQATNHPIDLVILDLTVPGGLGGAETIRQLRALDPEVVAIVSSGYSHDPVMANYQAHGFAGVLTKPYGLANLRKEIAKLEDRD